jgi:hypothetical protein
MPESSISFVVPVKPLTIRTDDAGMPATLEMNEELPHSPRHRPVAL